MRTGRLSRVVLAFLLLLALSGCGQQLATMSSVAPPVAPTHGTPRPAATVQPKAPISAALPVRLVIPAIGVNAAVERVGIVANGDLATPTGHPWDDVGWYDLGTLPGERGSAVIDGHLDRPGGYPAVFWYLRNIHVGDAVFVTEKDGKQLRFHVTRIAYYTPQDAPLQDIFGNRSGNYLNLITCAGDWIPSQGQTTLRLVVYTTLG